MLILFSRYICVMEIQGFLAAVSFCPIKITGEQSNSDVAKIRMRSLKFRMSLGRKLQETNVITIMSQNQLIEKRTE